MAIMGLYYWVFVRHSGWQRRLEDMGSRKKCLLNDKVIVYFHLMTDIKCTGVYNPAM